MTINTSDYSKEKLTLAQLMLAPFATGSLIVNFSQNQVTLDGETLVLQPKVLELLIILCAANGETVSKQKLIDTLWPDTIVGPDSLANTMTRLRKILNDDAKRPVFIKTVQRKGYLWLPSIHIESYKKSINIRYLAVILSAFSIAVLLYFLVWSEPEPEKFPFPDLSIQKLSDGGYEIQVGIEGELTAEKEAAMLTELKRITGEEDSGWEFTVDKIAPQCGDISIDDNEKKHCENKKHKQ